MARRPDISRHFFNVFRTAATNVQISACVRKWRFFKIRQSGEVPTDMVLICEGDVRMDAHALLVAAISPVLRAAIRPSSNFKEGETRTVTIEWAKAGLVERMFSFACGDSVLSGDDTMELFPMADRLDFGGLRTACESTLTAILTSDNAADIMACAEVSGCITLSKKSKDYIESPSVVSLLKENKNKLEIDYKDQEKKF